jgi:hypothetical protein
VHDEQKSSRSFPMPSLWQSRSHWIPVVPDNPRKGSQKFSSSKSQTPSQAETGRVIFQPMTSEEFHTLVEEYTDPSAADDGDTPLTLARLAELERHKGIKFPAFYKEFLSMFGAGDFGYVSVLSPDVDSKFPIWETATRLENRECSFMGVIELDSDYFGFLIEQGVCSNDIWRGRPGDIDSTGPGRGP